MNEIATLPPTRQAAPCYFDRPGVHMEQVPVGPGIPLGIECVANPELGIAGAYGSWGVSYDNAALPAYLADRLGRPLAESELLNLSELGFDSRQHLPKLSEEEHVALEVAVGTRLLQEAVRANGWEPSQVEAVLLGMTSPVLDGYTERIAREAGIPESALKVSVHKACDGSMGALNLALNPEVSSKLGLSVNLAQVLAGKKVLVGGIEGLSRVLRRSLDIQALQLFGTGAGIIGLIPGQTMRFLAGGTAEVYDDEGVLQVRMDYPHSGTYVPGQPMLEVTEVGPHDLRVAGLMHQPEDLGQPVVMAGPMGMVKLFVRNGVTVVRNVYRAYERRLAELDMQGKGITVAIAHHANLKINQMKGKHLEKDGICLSIPWVLRDFGNISAASNMIAFLRQLGDLHPGDHVLFDGFGAGTYYDVLAVEVGH